MKHILFSWSFFLLLLGNCNQPAGNNSPLASQDPPARTLRSDLNYPWEILWGHDNYIWMTERGGTISKIDPATGKTLFSHRVEDAVANNEGGMLGMVQDPGFVTNGYLYVVYDYFNGNQYREKLVKLRYHDDSIELVQTIVQDIPAAVIHNGSRLWISKDPVPVLYMTTGDASVQPNAQLLSSLSGKVLRFNLDGSIPADNPLPGSPVWSYGHRNAQGLVMVNGILYASEHGPDIEDEINIIERNRNYGWPTVNGPCDKESEKTFCEANKVKEPVWSSGDKTIAVCGLDYYADSLIPQWKNCLLLVSLKDQSLRSFNIAPGGQSITPADIFYKNKFGRLRDLCVSPQGKVYLCTSNGSNKDLLVELTGR
ncbi:MAG: PQQ-dependent sugar dehydrogenase [Ferruginibacter sp.]